MKRYQKQLEKLREETENFTKPFVDSSSDESDSTDIQKENRENADDEDGSQSITPKQNDTAQAPIENSVLKYKEPEVLIPSNSSHTF